MRHDLPPAAIRVLVVDGTRVHTELLADALKRDDCLQVSTLPPDSDRLTPSLDLTDCDVLLISSNLGDRSCRGIELLRGLRTLHSGLKAVVLLEGSQTELILEAFRAGAQGVFSKNDSVERLGKCIRKVYEGQIWADTGQMAMLTQALASSHDIRAVDARGLNLLSKREMEVVRGVALGLSNREIADRLHLSQHTIKNCLFRIFDKLGVSSRVELLFMTLSQGRDVQSVFQHLLSERCYENLRDEAVKAACQNAANRGVLIAQLVLAQYHAHCDPASDAAVRAYGWYSVVAEGISRSSRELAKKLSIEQVLEAEEMAAEKLSRSKDAGAVSSNARRPARRKPNSERARNNWSVPSQSG